MKPRRVSYGGHHAQAAELWRPPGAGAPRPVVVLIHGGFWRLPYTKRLMHPLARALAAHGWAVWNIEYRRVGVLGGGGWPETFEDVAAALQALAGPAGGGLDLERVVTCGHSAGGHLALWAGAGRSVGRPAPAEPRPVRVHTAVSLAGVADLAVAARRGVGGDAVTQLMGGGPDELPERYALASAAEPAPAATRQVLLHGLADASVPAALSRDFVEAARARGGDARYVPLPGVSHMDMIDPRGAAFPHLVACLDGVTAAGPR